MKRLRRKQSQENGNEGDDDEEVDEHTSPVHLGGAALEPLEEVPETEDDHQEVHSEVKATGSASVPFVPASEPLLPPQLHSVSAPPAANRLGVIGKASSKTLEPVAAAAPAVESPLYESPSFPLNPADQHHYHQQHLINLLLGDSPARAPARSAAAQPASQLQLPAYQPYSNAGYNFSTQPSPLYAPAAAPQRVNVAAPPGINTFRPAPLPDLNFAPASAAASQLTPPPPGLSPIGAGVTTSRFSFGDFNSTAPLNVPVLPQYQYQYQQPPAQTYAPLGSYPTSAAPSNAAAAPAGNYYKSKSGFSVRL